MFWFSLNIVKNIEVDVFFKHRLKMTSLRIGKHCIVKKSEHRPPLGGSGVEGRRCVLVEGKYMNTEITHLFDEK